MARSLKEYVDKQIARLRFSSLRSRLLLLLSLTLLPAFGLIVYSAIETRQQAAGHALANATWLTRLITAQQEAMVETAHQQLRTLAQLPIVRRPDSAVLCSQTFAEIRKQNPLYLNLGVIDPDGTLRCSALPFTGKVDFSDRSCFLAAMEQRNFAIGDYQIGPLSGRGTVSLAYPVLDEPGKPLAVVFIALDFDALVNKLVETSTLPGNPILPESLSITLVDDRGTVLARQPDADKWVGRAWPNAPLVKTIHAHPEAGTAREMGVDGVERLYAFAPVQSSHANRIYTVVGIPTATVFADSQRLFARALLLMTLIAAMALAATWIGTNTLILRPLATLMGTARRLRQGDLGARTGRAHSKDEFGQLARGFDDMADALQLRQSEAARAEARFASIIDLSADAIISVDEGQRVLIFNQGAAHIFGYSTTEMLGQPLDRLLPERFVAAHGEHIRAFARVPSTPRYMDRRPDIVGKRKDGSEFPAEASISRATEDGKLIFTVFLRDISARKQAEAEILALNAHLELRVQQRTAELHAANQELEAFSYSVSHDLRAPLRAIDGFSLAVVEDCAAQLDDKAKGYLSRVRTATQRMGQLIDDMLALAQVTRASLRAETVDMSALATDVVADLQKANPGRTVDWRIEPGLRARGDPRLLRVALVNLFDNAWKFTGRQPQPRIEFGARRDTDTDTDTIEFFIRDNGVGFDMAHAGKLFGAFQRLHSVAEFPGTGIGLATVKRVLIRHCGQVSAESTPGQGATFHFTLPASRGYGASP
ncbi:MAG: sensor histidine kinase [Porticoccaceae bacterium]